MIMTVKNVVLICCLLAGTNALKCLQCVNVEVKSGSSALKEMLGGRTDPECGSPSVTDNPNSDICSDPSSVCGLVESTTTAKSLIGDVTFKIQARSCMDPPVTITHPTCYDGNDDVIGAVKTALNLFLAFSYDLTVDGRVCYCSTDLCSAGGCGDGKVGIFGYCMEWSYWLMSAIAGILTLLLLTCCCCCCCACCRSKKTYGAVVPVQPQAVVVTTSGGVTGIENPGYANAHS